MPKTKIEKLNEKYPFGFAEFIEGLRSPTNRAIFRVLAKKPMTAKRVARELDISDRVAKRYLKEMHKQGILQMVNVQVVGGVIRYSYGVYPIHIKIAESIESLLNAWKKK